MTIGLIGKKIGMTREFFDIGISVPVTVLSIEKGRILDVITKEKRGYNAIQVGFGKIKNSKLSKQMKGFFSKKSTEPKRILKEFRVENIADFKEGNEIGIEFFNDQKFVDVTAKTIAGHMGDKVRTIQNLEIIKSDLENNLIFLKGSIPGSKNSFVLVKKTAKAIKRTGTLEKINKMQTESSKTSVKKNEKSAPKEKKWR